MLRSTTATEVLTQAVLTHPMLAARWRWNCNRALLVPRSRGGQRRPIHLQRMDADDLLAAAWPQLAACQENAAPGPIPVPGHVLVRQTVADCLTEALDAPGLVDLLAAVEAGRVRVHVVESPEPSPLAHGILTGRPYTFLDGAPLEERRSRAVPLRRGLGPTGPGGLPVPADELGPLDGPAVAEVLDQVRPGPATPTSCTTSSCRSSPAGRSTPGPGGSPIWWPTAGRPRSAAPGCRPSGWARPGPWPTTTRRRPTACAGTSRWPGRCRWRPWWPPTRCPLAPRPAPR